MPRLNAFPMKLYMMRMTIEQALIGRGQ